MNLLQTTASKDADPVAEAPQDIAGTGGSPGALIRIGLLIILILSAFLAFGFMNNYQNWGDDWAQYMLQGKAILDGNIRDSMQQNAFMNQESAVSPGPVAYPWGLPFLLACEGKVFSFNLQVFKLFNIVFFLALVVASFTLAEKFMSSGRALAVASMFAFNPVLLHYCNHVLTEIPFALLSVCAFIAMENRGQCERSHAVSRLVTGALAFAAFTFRTNGILILAAASVREFVPDLPPKVWRRPKLMELLSPYVSFFLLNAIWRTIFPAGGEGYAQLLRAISVHTLITNALTYPVALFDLFTGGHHTAVFAVLGWPFVLWGVFKTWRKSPQLSVYLFMTLALYIVWPEGQGYRFMIPVTPILVILLMIGLEEFSGWRKIGGIGPLLARSFQFGFPILFLLASSAVIVLHRVPQEKWHPYDPPSSEMFHWIRSHTPESALISFFKPRAMHLLGGRLCLTATPADVPKASYFVYTKESSFWNEGQRPLETYQQAAALKPVFENRNFIVFHIERNP